MWRRFFEWLCVACHYYPAFFLVDCAFFISYFFQGPYRISRKWLQKHRKKDVYTYGETPLCSLETIVDLCEIASCDVVYEVGCGRGKAMFWLRKFVGCQVVGIELISDFVKKAVRIQNVLGYSGLSFLEKDALDVDFEDATVIYFYGTCASDKEILRLAEKWRNVAARIITVSFSLADYTDDFVVLRAVPVRFTWGVATVYLQVAQ